MLHESPIGSLAVNTTDPRTNAAIVWADHHRHVRRSVCNVLLPNTFSCRMGPFPHYLVFLALTTRACAPYDHDGIARSRARARIDTDQW
jgi:hypothetical protein